MSPEESTLNRYALWGWKLYQDWLKSRRERRHGSDTWMYLSVWFALLYVTIEGWRALRLRDDRVRDLLRKQDYVRRLGEYRHAVAHFNAQYWNERFAGMVEKRETLKWAEDLTDAFQCYFARRAIETDHPAVKALERKR